MILHWFVWRNVYFVSCFTSVYDRTFRKKPEAQNGAETEDTAEQKLSPDGPPKLNGNGVKSEPPTTEELSRKRKETTPEDTNDDVKRLKSLNESVEVESKVDHKLVGVQKMETSE